MLDTAILAFTTMFATIGPLDVAAMFAVLTANDTAAVRRRTALRSSFVATVILLVFALLGEVMLRSLGISIAPACLREALRLPVPTWNSFSRVPFE
jgi:multiple antibiotic resistance protein